LLRISGSSSVWFGVPPDSFSGALLKLEYMSKPVPWYDYSARSGSDFFSPWGPCPHHRIEGCSGSTIHSVQEFDSEALCGGCKAWL
jgi:hypothetical protein